MTLHRTAGQDPESNDVVLLLERQHEEIRHRMEAVLTATGRERARAFRRFVHLLAVHETAEEEIVHPFVRHAAEGGAGLVDDRLGEEEAVERELAALGDGDLDAEDFVTRFTEVYEDVLAHARAEEEEEFPRLREAADDARLQLMAKALRAAEAVAPTRPHPGTSSAAGNLALGPFAAVVDRTREAIRLALGR
ncbi:hemerythrin domain-containing protein [Streptomyces caatingaensis]|uniref:Hemerythrin n=1 Tax=Streptomyces caatingaensis TaxID=1678637 RepID=A0A0K9XL50_9ACTN|nr:hemerythrin domain-containing protein [Streptomyces caatingaensis]KNB54060.1 hemerythrin [Streptomyces caatingaensis]